MYRYELLSLKGDLGIISSNLAFTWRARRVKGAEFTRKTLYSQDRALVLTLYPDGWNGYRSAPLFIFHSELPLPQLPFTVIDAL